tara:strand:+ start:3091 stop:3339 length:249 start_codon:yes stop_codon:yes gene_type:complete
MDSAKRDSIIYIIFLIVMLLTIFGIPIYIYKKLLKFEIDDFEYGYLKFNKNLFDNIIEIVNTLLIISVCLLIFSIFIILLFV